MEVGVGAILRERCGVWLFVGLVWVHGWVWRV